MLGEACQRKVENTEAGRSIRPAIETAMAEVRRGAGVILHDAEGGAVLIVTAEMADGAHPVFGRVAAAPVCVIPRARAAALPVSAVDEPKVAISCGLEGAGESFDAAIVRVIAGVDGDIAPLEGRTAVAVGSLQDAAVELVKLARLLPAAVVARIHDNVSAFADREDLLVVPAGWVESYWNWADRCALTLVTRAPIPLEGVGDSEIYVYRPDDGGKEHLAIVIGDPAPDQAILVRIHSECFTGDLLGSLRCNCGEQLRGAIKAIAEAGGGVLLYLAQEGRGIGLVNKLRAYRLQDEGLDTIDANERLGFDADERVYNPAAAMLRALGFSKVRLLTNNPIKVEGLAACGIDVVERFPHAFPANGHNERYLHTKASRAGHLLLALLWI